MRLDPGAETPPSRRSRAVLLALAVLTPAVASRAFLVGEWNGVASTDGIGLLADVAASALVLTVVLCAARVSRALGMLCLLLWIAANLLNHESVTALDALASLRDVSYLADGTFLQGSALRPLSPLLFLVVGVSSIALGWPGLRARPPLRAVGLLAVSAVGLVALHASIPWDPDLATWRQSHVLLHNLRDIRSSGGAPSAGEGLDGARWELDAVVGDLQVSWSGESQFDAPPLTRGGRRPNVLLILIESISGAYLESIASAHGRSAGPSMPGLDAFARKHQRYSSFITHQINTNRGLYSVLCGDLPKLLSGTPKMSILATRGSDHCLPAILGRAGYRSLYFQAAPLAFMMKDQFMAGIGFEDVRGAAAFHRAHARSAWGVDDRTFFEGAAEAVRALDAKRSPWFATLLTVGTHHPFLVPDDFSAPGVTTHRDDDRFADAVAYADRYATRFLEEIEREGLLESTLVLVSSDESRGIRTGDAISQLISQNWGFLIAAGPGLKPSHVTEPFALSDLPASVLDYLDLVPSRGDAPLLGRSVFRRGAKPRLIFFGNTRRQAAGAVDSEGRLLLCRRRLEHCTAFRPRGGRLFAESRTPLAWSPERAGIVGAVASYTLSEGAPQSPVSSLELMAERRITIPAGETRMLYGGQNVELAAGDWLETEIDLAVRGEGSLALQNILRDSLRVHMHETRELAGGSRYRLRYRFVPQSAVAKVQSMSIATGDDRAGGALQLDFDTARVTVHHGDAPGETGLTVLRDEIEP